MMSDTSPTFGVATPIGVERAPQRRQIALRDMRQHQVLLVADADLAERITIGQIGDRVHLLGGGSRPACRLPA